MPKKDYYQTLAPIITAAGLKAKNKWKTFRRTDAVLKSATEIVTAIDKQTEKELIKHIKTSFPDHAFLGEESGSSGQSDYVWIIDPIDGTTNFSIHNPLWCISIGLAYKGEIIFGIIYAPVLDELFWAAKGKGAFFNNKRLKASRKRAKGKDIHAFCHGQTPRDMKRALAYYSHQKLNSLDCRQLGSAAIELAYVAAGHLDSILIFGANAWDVAAGALIAKEAGASVSDSLGRPWTIKSEDILVARKDLKTSIVEKIKNIK